MSCQNCDWSKISGVLTGIPNAILLICACTERIDGKLNPHYLHILNGEHSCEQDTYPPYSEEDKDKCEGVEG